MKNIFFTKIVIFVVFTALVFMFSGCGKTIENNTIQEPEFSAGEFKEFGDPKYNVSIKYPDELISDFSNGVYYLEFPEVYSTGTNLLGALVRFDGELTECEGFGSNESISTSWNNSEALEPTGNLAEKFIVNGIDFKRFKCSQKFDDGVFSESVSYTANLEKGNYTLSLFFFSVDPVECDPEVCKKKFDPTGFEKTFLRILNSFKTFNPEIYD